MNTFSLERQSFLDALRGFAILGIILVNISVFSSVYYGSGMRDPLMISTADYAINFLISVFFETKFYLLFSFLFGYSFTIQMVSATRKQQRFSIAFTRRLIGLFLIGLLHAILLYHGDILTTYALMGAVLFLLRNQRDDTLIRIAIGLVILTALCWLLIALETDNHALDTVATTLLLQTKARNFLGNWPTIVGQHWHEWHATLSITFFMQAPTALAMFCLGFIAGKRQLFLNFNRYQKPANYLWISGLIVGLPSAVLYGYATTFNQNPQLELLALALSILTGPLLSMAYIVLLFNCYHTTLGQTIGRWLVPIGQTALSNYILQSFICTLLFFGVGSGLMGTTSPTATFLIAFTIFIIQSLLSKLWLKFFKYGPLEWLLRCFTKWQWLSIANQ